MKYKTIRLTACLFAACALASAQGNMESPGAAATPTPAPQEEQRQQAAQADAPGVLDLVFVDTVVYLITFLP